VRAVTEDGKIKSILNSEIILDNYYLIPDLKFYGNFLIIQYSNYNNSQYENTSVCCNIDFSNVATILKDEERPGKVIAWDEHSLVYKPYLDQEEPQNESLYLYSDLEINEF
jgi:hypothetical protein